MLTLPRLMVKASKQLQDELPWVWLYELEVPTTPLPTRYRFTNNTQPVNFGTNSAGDAIEYLPFPVLHGDIRQTTEGDLPRIQIQLGYPSLELRANVDEFDGLVGSPAIIRLVHTGNLDDPQAQLRFDGEVTATKIPFGADRVAMTISAFNLLEAKFPSFRYQAFHCGYDWGDEKCGMNRLDAALSAAGFTFCDHTLDGPSGCRALGAAVAASQGNLWPERCGLWLSIGRGSA